VRRKDSDLTQQTNACDTGPVPARRCSSFFRRTAMAQLPFGRPLRSTPANRATRTPRPKNATCPGIMPGVLEHRPRGILPGRHRRRSAPLGIFVVGGAARSGARYSRPQHRGKRWLLTWCLLSACRGGPSVGTITSEAYPTRFFELARTPILESRPDCGRNALSYRAWAEAGRRSAAE
jgi:hypothetical protein